MFRPGVRVGAGCWLWWVGGLRVEGVPLPLCVLFACVLFPFSFLFCHHKQVKAGGWAVVPVPICGLVLFITLNVNLYSV